MKKILFVVLGLGIAFVAGYLPKYFDTVRLSDELEQSSSRYETRLLGLEEQNRILQLQRDLGTLLLEVEDRNYGRARELSTRFFDQLTDTAASTSGAEARRILTSLSQRRDTLTAMLTEANPDTVTQVRQMYQTLTTATRTN